MNCPEALAELRKNPALCLKDLTPLITPPETRAGFSRAAASPEAGVAGRHPLQPLVGLQEWFYAMPDGAGAVVNDRRRDWFVPLTVMSFLAGRNLSVSRRPYIFFIGRRCWPSLSLVQAVMSEGRWRKGAIFLDPSTTALRFWAMDQALRCPAVAAVVAEAGGGTPADSRRLQLAAEAGGGYGLLARPVWEQREISAAQERWLVAPQPTQENYPRWRLELLRSRGPTASWGGNRAWMVQWRWDKNNGGGALRMEADGEIVSI